MLIFITSQLKKHNIENCLLSLMYKAEWPAEHNLPTLVCMGDKEELRKIRQKLELLTLRYFYAITHSKLLQLATVYTEQV